MVFQMNRAAGVVAALVASAGLLASGAHAQWTADTAANTVVADGAGSQGTPIVRAAADGGVWIFFWEGGAGPGLKPAIQRLDASGTKVFPGNGIILANRLNTASFTTDMKVDAAGNAYASFDDDSSGTTVTRAQKITPAGVLAWGPTGVQMPTSTNSFSTRVAPCADGTVVCMYAVSNVLYFQRIAANGTLVSAWTIAEASRAQSPSDLIAGSTGGDVIAMWVRNETTGFTSRKGLKAQKFNASNAPQWNGGVALDVYASVASPTRSLGNGYFPSMVADGQGGAVIAWYDGGAARNAWLQHVLPDGTQRFPANGLAMSSVSSASEYRLSAAVSYNTTTGDYVVAFETSNTLQSQFGLSAQRVSNDGTIEWGSAGKVLIPVVAGSNHKSFVSAQPGPDNSAVLAWLDYQGANFPMLVKARRLDSTGADVWAGALNVGSGVTTKGRLGLVKAVGSDMMIAGWSDDGSGTTDIKAQNINMNGTFGPAAGCYADFNNDGGIDGGDIEAFFAAWEAGAGTADVNADGGVDGADIETFFAAWEAGGC
ncbi:MAG: hypothetical protein NTV94_03225 [Planctomycetota bacterium]|nr:hypothetical protein [Planctomycetota bacterium]